MSSKWPEVRAHGEALRRPSVGAVFMATHAWDVAIVKWAVRLFPEMAQTVLEDEYRNPNGPRWTLTRWLKRHRPHNPTTRVVREER